MEEMQQQMHILKETLDRLNRETDQAHDEKRENKRRISMFQEDLQEINLKSNTLYVNISQLETSAAGQGGHL